jgi:hypothetical protein
MIETKFSRRRQKKPASAGEVLRKEVNYRKIVRY